MRFLAKIRFLLVAVALVMLLGATYWHWLGYV